MNARIVERIAGNHHTLILTATQAKTILNSRILTHEVELTAAILRSAHIRHTRVGIKVKANTLVGKDGIGAAQPVEAIDNQCPALLTAGKVERKFLRRKAATAIVERSHLETVEHALFDSKAAMRLTNDNTIVEPGTVDTPVYHITTGLCSRFKSILYRTPRELHLLVIGRHRHRKMAHRQRLYGTFLPAQIA